MLDKETQHQRIIDYITKNGPTTRVDLNRWGGLSKPPIASADSRARELIADNRLIRRPLTEDERIKGGFKDGRDIVVYDLSPLEKDAIEQGRLRIKMNQQLQKVGLL